MAWRPTLSVPVALFAVLLCSSPSLAHHGAWFDENTSVKLQGAVTKIDWKNPHPFIYLDVKADSGEVRRWAVELTSLRQASMAGADQIKVGDTITVVGFLATTDRTYRPTDMQDLNALAKAGYLTVRGAEITLANGSQAVLPESPARAAERLPPGRR